jgi:dipeptidyl aminopeptidase/acylaminoacyl peptidase
MTIPFERYLNVRSAYSGSMRHDSERLAFLTDITGTAQLWAVNEPLSWPEQLTFSQERLLFASYNPARDIIAFGQDQGGNEVQLIYGIDGAGGLAGQLSQQEAKHIWGGWSHNGVRAAWGHNARNGRDFDIYIYDLEQREERLVWQAEGSNYVAGWMPDDRQLIIGRLETNIDNNLWLLDLDTSSSTLLTPHAGDALFSSPEPTPDGSGIFLLTDLDRDYLNLAFYDVADAQLRFIDDHPWDRESIALSDDGRWLVVLTNEEGYTIVEVHDLEQGQQHRVGTLPAGVAGGVRFAPARPVFTLTVTGPDDAMDVWSVDVRTLAATRWTRSSLAGIPLTTRRQPELIHYTSFDGLAVPAFYYRPSSPAPYPVLIDIHGGPESQRRPSFSPVTQYLVNQGFAVLAPNVRGSSGYGKTYQELDDVRRRMDSVADIKAAYEWLVGEGGADPERIALYGGSYGGFMVLSAMVTYPDLWAAGVDIVGIANFITFLENTADYRRHLRESEYGSLADDREFLRDISPLTHIDNIGAPLMVIHGANDPRVPVGEADQIIEAVRAKGLPVEALIYEDEGHGLAKLRNRLDAYPKMAEFLKRHVNPTGKADDQIS